MPRVSAVAILLLGIVLGASAEPQAAAKSAITALAVTPDGKGFVQGSQAGVRLRPFQGDESSTIATKLDHVHALTFSPDGKSLAIAGGSPAENGAIELWTWPERKLVGRLDGHADVVYDVVWLDGGKRLATASADRGVRLWDFASRKNVATLVGHSGPVLALAVSPDGAWLCSGSADHTIRVWSAADGKLVRALVNHLGPVHQLAFRPASAKNRPPYLASAGGDSTVRIWQPSIGRMVRIVRHPEPVLAIAWIANGSLYSGGKDGILRVLDGDSDKVLYEERHGPVAFTSLAIRATSGLALVGNAHGDVHLAGK
jgi:WD40 repeat protein